MTSVKSDIEVTLINFELFSSASHHLHYEYTTSIIYEKLWALDTNHL